ncbi:Hypothetical predicted protein [Lecanosticta acicola]|uniref:Uncharacterized protein n=1 Tax=Lecanosticta acicola TaxID=111012 RepID=A0AAI8Z2E8_9PEZI|nr:Hypothetical predicted protein [Lecanosticta acicola]
MSSSHSAFTSSSFSYSSSSTSDGQTTTSGQRQMRQSYTDPSGNTTTKSARQNLGEAPVLEQKNYDAQGRQLLSGGTGGSVSRRIEDVSDEQQAQRDREYEERMEDEYAKREGGA